MGFTQRKALTRRILQCLGAGAVLFSVLIAPNAPKAIRRLIAIDDSKDTYRLKRALQQLARRGLVRLRHLPNSETAIELTKKGKTEVLKYRIENIEIDLSQPWDGRWRVVIFDIPEHKKEARDALRRQLDRLGFWQLQKSVFVLPYPCEKEIEFLRQFFEIAEHVHLLEAKTSDADLEEVIRAKFDL